jgi:YHS domain-containing protein
MITDPVCGISVDDNDSQHQARYGGQTYQTYSFCSQQCKNEFEQNPEQYAKLAAQDKRSRWVKALVFYKGLSI